jgi:hypothetical protein
MPVPAIDDKPRPLDGFVALELDDPPCEGVWGGTSKRERRALRRRRVA